MDQTKDVIKELKKVSKKGMITLYKAFKLVDDDEMRINTNVEVFSLTLEDSVKALFIEKSATYLGSPSESVTQEELQEIIMNKWEEFCPYGSTISVIMLSFDEDELLKKEILVDGEVCLSNGSILVTLDNKTYSMDVADYLLKNIEFTVDKETEIKKITKVELEKIE